MGLPIDRSGRERCVLSTHMLQFTDKAHALNNPQKIQDEEMTKIWHENICMCKVDQRPIEEEMSHAMWQYCNDELVDLVENLPSIPGGPIPVFYDVHKSDTAVPEPLSVRLEAAVPSLINEQDRENGKWRDWEDVPESEVKCYPSWNGKVRAVVNPSLYPLVYGRTRVLQMGADSVGLQDCVKRSGEGRVVGPGTRVGDKGQRDMWKNELGRWSNRFQWLPCEVDVSGQTPRYSFCVLIKTVSVHMSKPKDTQLHQQSPSNTARRALRSHFPAHRCLSATMEPHSRFPRYERSRVREAANSNARACLLHYLEQPRRSR